MLKKMFTDSPIEYLLYVRKGRPEEYYSELFFEFDRVLNSTEYLLIANDSFADIVPETKRIERIGPVVILHITDELKYAIVEVNIRKMAGF